MGKIKKILEPKLFCILGVPILFLPTLQILSVWFNAGEGRGTDYSLKNIVYNSSTNSAAFCAIQWMSSKPLSLL